MELDERPHGADPGWRPRRLSWPVAALLIAGLSALGWGLIGLITWSSLR